MDVPLEPELVPAVVPICGADNSVTILPNARQS